MPPQNRSWRDDEDTLANNSVRPGVTKQAPGVAEPPETPVVNVPPAASMTGAQALLPLPAQLPPMLSGGAAPSPWFYALPDAEDDSAGTGVVSAPPGYSSHSGREDPYLAMAEVHSPPTPLEPIGLPPPVPPLPPLPPLPNAMGSAPDTDIHGYSTAELRQPDAPAIVEQSSQVGYVYSGAGEVHSIAEGDYPGQAFPVPKEVDSSDWSHTDESHLEAHLEAVTPTATPHELVTRSAESPSAVSSPTAASSPSGQLALDRYPEPSPELANVPSVARQPDLPGFAPYICSPPSGQPPAYASTNEMAPEPTGMSLDPAEFAVRESHLNTPEISASFAMSAGAEVESSSKPQVEFDAVSVETANVVAAEPFGAGAVSIPFTDPGRVHALDPPTIMDVPVSAFREPKVMRPLEGLPTTLPTNIGELAYPAEVQPPLAEQPKFAPQAIAETMPSPLVDQSVTSTPQAADRPAIPRQSATSPVEEVVVPAAQTPPPSEVVAVMGSEQDMDMERTSLYAPPRPSKPVADVAWLAVLKCPNARSNQIFWLDSPRMELGRKFDAPIFVDDRAVSSRHAAIRYESVNGRHEFVLYDLASTNGSIVNGASVHTAILRDNDRIRVGETELVFKKVGDAQPTVE